YTFLFLPNGRLCSPNFFCDGKFPLPACVLLLRIISYATSASLFHGCLTDFFPSDTQLPIRLECGSTSLLFPLYDILSTGTTTSGSFHFHIAVPYLYIYFFGFRHYRHRCRTCMNTSARLCIRHALYTMNPAF